MLLIILLVTHWNEQAIIKKLLKKKISKEGEQMTELAKRFIGKECILYTFNSQQYDGTLTEVTDSALVLARKDGSEEIINLEFVLRIREHPKKKNGKKKDIVLD
jgi:hypothetical protein